jgi:hypothetical protein
MKRLENKVALITDGAGSIGFINKLFPLREAMINPTVSEKI